MTDAGRSGISGFRTKLLVAMMLVVSGATAVALFLAQRSVSDNVRRDFESQFQNELATVLSMQQVRRAALVERCRALARKPRIHAALEDNALDLLYPSAREELLDLMQGGDADPAAQNPFAVHAVFYRFLDAAGTVIPPPDAREVGRLSAAEEAQLAARRVPQNPQIGYLSADDIRASRSIIKEVMTVPIHSSETGQTIAALAIGFAPTDLFGRGPGTPFKTGIWVGGKLHLPQLADAAAESITRQLREKIPAPPTPENSFSVQIEGKSWLLFYKLINADSTFPPAYQICIYPLSGAAMRQRHLFWQFVGAGGLLLVAAYAASRYLSIKLSVPVEKLEVDSETNRTQRERAEIALEMTSAELLRSARFSANASHQLKTPVTVLRAGLEELLAGERIDPELREEVASLVHQTFRLTSIIEDLLLLSRMDAGRLRLDLGPIDLTQLIASWLDDLGTLPDELHLHIETDLRAELFIQGEKRYTSVIIQNLLENARKYNVAGGRIRVAARVEGHLAKLTIGNTGAPIPADAQPHIFERFHRGSIGENVAGHGLGLNLARELARLHHGDLQLNRSDANWTEFEVMFCLASAPVPLSRVL